MSMKPRSERCTPCIPFNPPTGLSISTESAMRGNKFNAIGKTLGRLTVMQEYGRSKSGDVLWECQCACGKRTVVRGSQLKRGVVKSCGCLRKLWPLAHFKKHGLIHTKEYNAWEGMKQRCNNANSKSYYNYGGRGIRVCDKWANSFMAFLSDVGRCPAPGLSIDRINNNGNYEPGNVRWATATEQSRNNRGYKGGVKAIQSTETMRRKILKMMAATKISFCTLHRLTQEGR